MHAQFRTKNSVWIDDMVVAMTTGNSVWLLAVPFDICLFHMTFGCSIRCLAVPFDVCLFHSAFVCSIRCLSVPFNVCLFHSTFVCSIWCLAVPFDDWLIKLQSSWIVSRYFVLWVWLFHCNVYSCFTLWLVVLFQPLPSHLVCNCFICNYANLFNAKLF